VARKSLRHFSELESWHQPLTLLSISWFGEDAIQREETLPAMYAFPPPLTTLIFPQKFVFDGLLYLLTLLIHLVEASSESLTLLVTQLSAISKLPEPTTSMDRSLLEHHDGIRSLIEQLLHSLLEESKSFLSDLEQTDQMISTKLCKRQQMETQPPPLIEQVKPTSRDPRESKKLPVDEIILCSHIILFFISILRILPEEISSPDLIQAIQLLLPRGSWWLPKRILLAYLAFQDEVSPRLAALPLIFSDCRSIRFERRTSSL
jgi:hypothetical protein